MGSGKSRVWSWAVRDCIYKRGKIREAVTPLWGNGPSLGAIKIFQSAFFFNFNIEKKEKKPIVMSRHELTGRHLYGAAIRVESSMNAKPNLFTLSVAVGAHDGVTRLKKKMSRRTERNYNNPARIRSQATWSLSKFTRYNVNYKFRPQAIIVVCAG